MNPLNCQCFLRFKETAAGCKGENLPFRRPLGPCQGLIYYEALRGLEGIGVFLYNYWDTMVGSVNGLTMP